MRRFKTAAEIAAKIPDEGRAAAAMRREAAEVWSEMAALVDGPGEMQADDNRRYDALMRVHDDLTAAVAVRDAADAAHMAAQRAGVVPPGGVGVGRDQDAGRSPVLRADQSLTGWARAQHLIPEEHDTDAGQPLSFGKYMRGVVTGRWDDADPERAAMRETTGVPGQVFNAMSEGTLTSGGVLVPTILSTQLIDMARNRTRVIEAGAQVVPMKNSKIDLARWAGDPSAVWHSENTTITPTDATLSRVQLAAKALTSLVVVSRELVEDADPISIDSALQESFAAAFALTIDGVALYGTGVAPQPTGVKATAGVSVSPFSGVNGGTPANTDFLVNGIFALRNANESPTAVIYSPRTAKTVALMKDTTQQPLQMPPYLEGVARLETKQVGDAFTVGTSTDTSDAFFGDWRQLLLGVRTELVITPLVERYADQGSIGFLAWWRGDVAVARPAAFFVQSGLRP